jgi:hypothetical protein
MVLAAAGAGCTEKGRSIVLVNLTSDVMRLERIQIVVAQGTRAVGTSNQSWDGVSPSEEKIGVYVDKNVSGTVAVIACGFRGGAAVAASGMPDASTTVSPGTDSAPVAVKLIAGTPSSLCSGGAAGAGGGGGTAGGGGAGGTVGTGGASGAGGSSGSGGTSGAAGGGGAAGSGGGAGGRGGGTAGTGGAGGQAGVAGSGGAGGRGGAAGTGGSGGRGGSGGTGGSLGGSGGSAGSAGTGGKPPGWEGAMAVDTDPVVQARPGVAVDSHGNAVVAFEVGTDIWANYYDYATDKWKGPVGIDTRGGDAYLPRVAVDANGTYLVVWYQSGGSTYQGEWYSTSSDGMAWSSPTPLSTGAVYSSALAMNANGAAIAAWSEQDTATGNMSAYAATRPSTTGTWTAKQLLLLGDDTSDRNVVVAMSGTGEAFALWEQYDAGVNSIWMRQHTASGWGTGATQFESYNSAGSYAPAIAANASGQVVGTYLQDSGSITKMLSRRYTPTTGFSSNVLQVASASAIEWLVNPSLTLDDAGIATIAFSVSQPSGKWDVYTNRSGTGDNAWQGMMMMESDNDATADNAGGSNISRVPEPVLGHDAAGNVTMVWRKRTGTRFDVWAQRYAGGWGAAAPIETRDTNSAFNPVVGVGANGTAVAAWYYGTELTVYANVFR